uniref:Uncharacterized protein n=1 Tax=Strigamia maritima TaxID=126957 RepID=T1JBP0_STRMM
MQSAQIGGKSAQNLLGIRNEQRIIVHALHQPIFVGRQENPSDLRRSVQTQRLHMRSELKHKQIITPVDMATHILQIESTQLLQTKIRSDFGRNGHVRERERL